MERPPYRVSCILTRLNIGGPSVHVALLARGLDRRRFRLSLVVGQPEAYEGDLSTVMGEAGVRVIQVRWLHRAIRPLNDLLAFGALVRVMWRQRPSIIHTHMAKAGTLGRLAGLVYNLGASVLPGRSPAVLVHTFHGHVLDAYFSPGLTRLFTMIERTLARHTHCLIAVNKTVRNQLLLHGIGQPNQWVVIPLGVELSSLANLPPRTVTSSVRCGIIGRLVPVKNPEMFLHALERVMRTTPPASMYGVVVGDGPLRPHLERESRTLGLDGCVRFTGWQSDLSSVYRELDITCLTSWDEGTPTALIEAMAAGRLVVATDVGGVRELLGVRETGGLVAGGAFHIAPRGLLVSAGDIEGFAAALRCAAADAQLRQRLGREARDFVLQQYQAGRFIQDMTALYEQLMSQRGGTP